MTPDEFFTTITFVEGTKLINMHESHDHTMLSVGEIASLVKMTFLTPVTPR